MGSLQIWRNFRLGELSSHRLLPSFDAWRVSARWGSLRLGPSRKAAMFIAFPARAIPENVFSALAARGQQRHRRVSRWNRVLTMVFCPGAGNRQNALRRVEFGPTHSADFVAALGRQNEQLYDSSIVVVTEACPDFGKLAIGQGSFARPGFGRTIGAEDWVRRDFEPFSNGPIEHGG
jgi:hypothetical protein